MAGRRPLCSPSRPAAACPTLALTPHPVLTSRKPESSVCSSSFSSFLLSLYLSPSLPEWVWNTLMSVSIAVSSSEPMAKLTYPPPTMEVSWGACSGYLGLGRGDPSDPALAPQPQQPRDWSPSTTDLFLGLYDVGEPRRLSPDPFSVSLCPYDSQRESVFGAQP